MVLVLAFIGLSVRDSGRLDITTHGKPGMYRVASVSDGDTIKVEIVGKTETVRLIGIDTPETNDPRTEVQCFGAVASNKAKELLDSNLVRLEADGQSDDRDRYGRLLRYVYLENGTHINQYMVENGYAFAYTLFPNSKLENFRQWESEARANNRGLWSGCVIDESQQKKQTQYR